MEAENNDWENEDPNLLNVPELLYRETESLPLPDEVDPEREAEIWNLVKVTRDLILDNNLVLESISEHDEIKASEEAGLKVINHFTEVFEANQMKFLQNLAEMEKQMEVEPVWDSDSMEETFSEDAAERIIKWKETLNEFLECYSNIRKFIQEPDEQSQNAQIMEMEKKQLNSLPDIVEELKTFTNVLENFFEG